MPVAANNPRAFAAIRNMVVLGHDPGKPMLLENVEPDTYDNTSRYRIAFKFECRKCGAVRCLGESDTGWGPRWLHFGDSASMIDCKGG